MIISATHIQKFRNCQRIIGFEFVEGIKAPPTTKQEFGTRVHEQLERWLRKGVVPDNTAAGECAKQGIKTNWLPTPNEALLVEQRFEIPWSKRIRVKGFIDCVVPPGHTNDGVPVIIDHKTTSSLRYAKTKIELAEDPQAIMYSVWAMLKFTAPIVYARWMYYSASNPKSGKRKPTGAKPVEIKFEHDDPEFLESVDYILAEAERINHIRESKIKGLKLTANPNFCEMYGGCFYADICNLTPENRIDAYFEKDKIQNKGISKRQ